MADAPDWRHIITDPAQSDQEMLEGIRPTIQSWLEGGDGEGVRLKKDCEFLFAELKEMIETHRPSCLPEIRDLESVFKHNALFKRFKDGLAVAMEMEMEDAKGGHVHQWAFILFRGRTEEGPWTESECADMCGMFFAPLEKSLDVASPEKVEKLRAFVAATFELAPELEQYASPKLDKRLLP